MTYAPYQQAPAPAPTAPAGLAITALVIGILSFLVGWVPVLGILAGLVAVVFGVIALALRQSKPMSIVGLSLGSVAALTSLVVTIGLANLGDVATEAARSSSSTSQSNEESPRAADESSTTPTPATENDGSTRESPLPLGSTVTSKDWTVTVNSVNLDATQALADANLFNQPATEGHIYILVNITATYTGDDPQGSSPMTSVTYISPDGNTYDGLTDMAVAPDSFDLLSPLYQGASTTGNRALSVPADAVADGRIALRAGPFSDKVFFSMQ